MERDPIDALLRSLKPLDILRRLELGGRIRRTGQFVKGPEDRNYPLFEVVQSFEEANRSWQ
jgi:hypothetical protein